MKQLQDLIAEQKRLKDDIAAKEKELSQLKQRKEKLLTQEIPNLLIDNEMNECQLNDGTKVVVKQEVTGGLPTQTQIEKASGDERAELSEKKRNALDYLRSLGYDDAIKNKIEAELDRGQDNSAGEVERICEELGISCRRDENVHPQTLKSLVKNELEEGNDIDLDVLNMRTIHRAHIKEGK